MPYNGQYLSVYTSFEIRELDPVSYIFIVVNQGYKYGFKRWKLKYVSQKTRKCNREMSDKQMRHFRRPGEYVDLKFKL